MTQFHRDLISGQRGEKAREVIARGRRFFEARRELRQQGAELARARQRIDPATEFVEVRLIRPRDGLEPVAVTDGCGFGRQRIGDALPVHLRVREFLIQLDGKLEAGRCTRGPRAAHRGARLPIEGRIHLDRVEVAGVEGDLVEAFRTLPRGWIEDAVPGASTRRVVPARSSDAEGRRHS